jgi:hypothetical protein
MRFVDFLRVTVLLSAAAASLLAVICVLRAASESQTTIVLVSAAWWLVSAALGLALGRRAAVTPPIGRLLADSRAATMMPDHRPLATLLNRLWPLLLSCAGAAVAAFFAPQVSGIAAGFAIVWALAWRQQDAAVQAIEERDGVTFFVEQGSPVRPMTLVRIPGFRREIPTIPTAGSTG